MDSNYYHLNVKIISRGQGNSIVASAAYILGEKFRDTYTGTLHDRSYRRDVTYKRVILPPVAPRNLEDPQLLLNSINIVERRHDAQMARSLILALPHHLPMKTCESLIEEYIAENFTRNDMVAIVAIHRGELDESRKPASIEPVHSRTNNPHAHILVPFRALDNTGFQQTKTASRAMNTHDALISLRESWANLQNRTFEQLGLPNRVSNLSLAAQGICRQPTPHLGAAVISQELRGKQTSRGDMYRGVLEKNKVRNKYRDRIRNREYDREPIR